MQAKEMPVKGRTEAKPSKWPEMTMQEVRGLLSELLVQDGQWIGEDKHVRRMFEAVLARLHGGRLQLKEDPLKPLPTDLDPTAMPRCFHTDQSQVKRLDCNRLGYTKPVRAVNDVNRSCTMGQVQGGQDLTCSLRLQNFPARPGEAEIRHR